MYCTVQSARQGRHGRAIAVPYLAADSQTKPRPDGRIMICTQSLTILALRGQSAFRPINICRPTILSPSVCRSYNVQATCVPAAAPTLFGVEHHQSTRPPLLSSLAAGLDSSSALRLKNIAVEGCLKRLFCRVRKSIQRPVVVSANLILFPRLYVVDKKCS